jgi:hypothetical protein
VGIEDQWAALPSNPRGTVVGNINVAILALLEQAIADRIVTTNSMKPMRRKSSPRSLNNASVEVENTAPATSNGLMCCPPAPDYEKPGQPKNINTSMHSNNNDRLNEKLKLRESLTKEILADVEYEIDDVLAWAPESLTEEGRKSIRDQVNAQTRLVTDALTTEELQNEGARRSYTCRAVADARYLVNFQMAQGKKG